jgi:hypothetical protein
LTRAFAGSTRSTRATSSRNAEPVIEHSTGPNSRTRAESVSDQANEDFPTSTASETVDDVTGAA